MSLLLWSYVPVLCPACRQQHHMTFVSGYHIKPVAHAAPRLGPAGVISRIIPLHVPLHTCTPHRLAVLEMGHASTIKDSRQAYPSGHSAYMFFSMTILSLWACGKLGIFSRSNHRALFPKFIICSMPLWLATFVAVTRLRDYKHDFSDVNAGWCVLLSPWKESKACFQEVLSYVVPPSQRDSSSAMLCSVQNAWQRAKTLPVTWCMGSMADRVWGILTVTAHLPALFPIRDRSERCPTGLPRSFIGICCGAVAYFLNFPRCGQMLPVVHIVLD